MPATTDRIRMIGDEDVGAVLRRDFLEGGYQLSTTLPAEWSELTAL